MIRKILLTLVVFAVVAAVAFIPGRRPGWQRTAGSANWSGYAAVGKPGAFTSVSATFTVPNVKCPASEEDLSFAAFWVGLDGWKDQTVEQTGIEAECEFGTVVYSAWYEMYPDPSVSFPVTVKPGDDILASARETDGEYVLTLTDYTQNWTQTHEQQGSFQDSSAEIITEAPSDAYEILPLADFGSVLYQDCTIDGLPLIDENRYRVVIDKGGQNDKTSNLEGASSFTNTD